MVDVAPTINEIREQQNILLKPVYIHGPTEQTFFLKLLFCLYYNTFV